MYGCPIYTVRLRSGSMTPDSETASRFLSAIYPAIPGQLAVFALPARRSWFFAEHAAAARIASEWATKENLYIGVGCLQERPDYGRGTEDQVCAIPGVWADIDVRGEVHKAANLPPTLADAMSIIRGVGVRPSLIVESGYGLQAWWLFKEPWVFTSDRDRHAAKSLAVRWQALLRREASRNEWTVDATADLTRVLRIPGTINHKISGSPKLVKYHDTGLRYSEHTLIEAVEHISEAEADQTRRRVFGTYTGPPANLTQILDGCPWMTHCRDDAVALPEPEWYQMLTVVGRCEDAEHWAHLLSKPYPKYSQTETHAKLIQAVDRSPGPVTCRYIETTFGDTRFCLSCPHHGRITSPIQLGRQEEPPAQPPEIEWGDDFTAEKPATAPGRSTLKIDELPSVFDVAASVTPYLIPLYLPESSILILSGESGHGKSTVASLMAGAVADGAWFAGQEAQPRPVLILDRDNPAHVVSERLHRIGVTSAKIRIWGQWCREEPPDPAGATVLDWVKFCEPRPLVVIDSLLDFLGGDENESKVVREMFGRLRMLTGLGATVILIHHTGKAESSLEYRGSSAIKGSCDAAFKVSDLSPTPGILTRIQLKAWKMRVRISQHVILDWDDGEGSYLYRPPRGAPSNTETIQEILRQSPGAPLTMLYQMGSERGMTRVAVRSIVDNGIEGRWITTERSFGRGKHALKHYLAVDHTVEA